MNTLCITLIQKVIMHFPWCTESRVKTKAHQLEMDYLGRGGVPTVVEEEQDKVMGAWLYSKYIIYTYKMLYCIPLFLLINIHK